MIVRSGGETLTLEREPKEGQPATWKATHGPNAPPRTGDAEKIQRLLGFLGNLRAERLAAEKADPNDPAHVAAPFQGAVTVVVDKGEEVEAGQTVATIEAMKMEASITAPVSGTVKRLAIGPQQQVEGGDLLLVIGS